mgnify:CR=1 FL=1
MYTPKIKLKQTKRLVRKLLLAPVLLLVTMTSQFSNAEIMQVSASNQPSTVNSTSSSQHQLSWRVSQGSSIGGQATISSSVGRFYSADGTLLGRTNTPIQSSRLTQLRVTTLFVLNESLTVPLSIIRAAQKLESAYVIYQRSFTDSQDATTRTASVNFQITHKTVASKLVVNRIQMQFEDGRTSGIFGNQTDFSASAFISYQGTGLLEYSWEIARPPSTAGKPIFFPLISRKQYLLSGGQVTLQSPSLPSANIGNHLVRLKISSLAARESIPTIRYTINNSTLNNANIAVDKLTQNTPLVDALLMPTTEFRWTEIQGASAYQLELHTKPTNSTNSLAIEQDLPVTGVLIPASKNHLNVGKVSRSYLIPGNHYYWRVIAINETGQIIARSGFRRIKF